MHDDNLADPNLNPNNPIPDSKEMGCGWVPNMHNVTQLGLPLWKMKDGRHDLGKTADSGRHKYLQPVRDLYKQELEPNENAKCLACSDLLSTVSRDRMVGCVPYHTKKEHYQILRGDGLSQHPLRRHRVKGDPSSSSSVSD